MTMKKVLVFALVLALAVGGIGFAHAAVTGSQDDLTVYPTLEVGDPTALEGLTASMTFQCGPHLRWHTDYPFGGDAVTEFVYHRKSIEEPMVYDRSTMEVYLSGGFSSSVSGGSFTPNSTDYGPLLAAVAAETPDGGSKTMELLMKDYVNYYVPDYELRYEDESLQCYQAASTHGFVAGDEWHGNPGCYVPLMQAFRFPVQEGHIMSVSVQKDDAGRIVSIDLYPKNGPELQFLSDVTAEGVWFVPIFRDEAGMPLAYESPQGHGIYFIPWMRNDRYLQTAGQPKQVTLNVKEAQLRFPLEDSLLVRHMVIDAEAGIARMLTLEDGMYVLTTCDLESGTTRSRLELLPYDPDDPDTTACFHQEGDYLLFLLQSSLALTDAEGQTLHLTAPEARDQRFGARFYDPDTGDLRFDGETLILADSTWYREGTFWAAAWRQGALRFYGEYDCSIMRGNDDWYYSYVTAEEHPLTLN